MSVPLAIPTSMGGFSVCYYSTNNLNKRSTQFNRKKWKYIFHQLWKRNCLSKHRNKSKNTTTAMRNYVLKHGHSHLTSHQPNINPVTAAAVSLADMRSWLATCCEPRVKSFSRGKLEKEDFSLRVRVCLSISNVPLHSHVSKYDLLDRCTELLGTLRLTAVNSTF